MVRRVSLLFSLCAGACWTSAGAPPPTPVVAPTLPSTHSAQELATELAAELRDPSDPMSPSQYIDRAVVVLELATGTTTTLCDAQALGAALTWGDMLRDPDRRSIRCFPGSRGRFTCVQHGPERHDTIMLRFRRTDTWSLRGVSIGPWRAHDEQLLAAHRARLDDATCP